MPTLRTVALAGLLLAARADAGQVLTYVEEGTRGGKPYRSTVTLSVAAEGVRVAATETDEAGVRNRVVFVYRAAEGKVFPVEPPAGPVISAATTAVVEERARAAGRRRRPGAFTVTPLHSTQAFGTWTCEAWAIRRPGQTTTIACLADPKSLGVDDVTRGTLRRMGDLFVPFANAVRLADGGDAREGYNTHALEGGFPVREFRSKDGVVEVDSRLLSVENADLPLDFFRVPEAPTPSLLDLKATPAQTPEPPAPPDRSIPLEGWALRGMPDAARPWTAADYDAAARVLEAAAKEDPPKLPRAGSAASGDLFRRFVADENLAPVRSGGTPAARAQAGGGILSGAGRLSLVYAGAYRDDASLDGELAALMSYTLLASHETVPLADSLLAAPKKKEKAKDRYARESERAKLADGLEALVSGCLESLATPAGFRPAGRRRLAQAVEEHLPALAPHLPAGARRQLPARLRKMAAAETDPGVKASLERTGAALAKPRAKAA